MSIFILLSFLTFGFMALAQESDLPLPGLTPDSPFYFLKAWKESIQMFFTFGEENKARQFLHLSEVRLAEYKKMIEKGKTEIAQKILEKYEEKLGHALEKADQAQEKGKDVEKLKEAISEKILKHQEVLEGVLEKVPEEAKKGIENAIEMSSKGFENAIQAVSGEKREELERKAEEVKIRIEEKMEAGTLAPKEIPEVCIQVITPAVDPNTDECKEFPTPCDVPAGWSKIDKCSVASPTPAEKFACCNQEACKLMAYEECFPAGGQRRIGVSSCSPNPCIVTGLKKYPSGSCTPGEVINYKCSDGTSFKWCVCDDLGWDCGLTYKYAERLCPASKEITVESEQLSDTCTPGEAINYKCAVGTIVRWCICNETGWECGLDYKDAEYRLCPQPGPPVISSVKAKPVEGQSGVIGIYWNTSEPATSRLEYGPTISYGFTAGPDYFSSAYHGVQLSNLQPNTTYHFRIRARDKDSVRNTTVSDDYTFFTGL